MAKPEKLPAHMAVIMDGNGRWAKKRGLPRKEGHIAGAKTFQRVVRYCNRIGLRYMTVYAFSTENWKRPPEEVAGILTLLENYLKDAKNYRDENIKVRFLGDLSVFPDHLQVLMAEAEAGSADATGLTVNIAVNYGGQDELLRVMRRISRDGLAPEEIDAAAVEQRLDTHGQPPVDLVVRPSGEQRLSNFLLWQTAYAEFVFLRTLWPDCTERTVDKALRLYGKRNRRFGGV